MNTYNIKSLPIHSVLKDLAEGLETTLTEWCNHYLLKIPAKIGEGFILGIDLNAGFGLINYNCHFYQNTQLAFSYEQVHPMKFMHCYEGAFVHSFENEEIYHHTSQYENMIVASSTINGHILDFAAKQTVKICSIEIERKQFSLQNKCRLAGLGGTLGNVITDVAGNTQFYHHGKYSLKISNLIEDIIDYRLPDLSGSFFIQGRCFQLLSLQWDQFVAGTTQRESSRTIRREDVEIMDQICRHIQQHLEDRLTVKDLKEQFFISEKRIQLLFRTIYNVTFKEYVNDLRLSKALDMLKNPELNISDVVYSIGLNNRSYFTRLFKARYGITPSDYVSQWKAE